MNLKNRLIFSTAIVILSFLYFLPLWRIDLEAPQYPEGIGLKIMINDIEGKNPNDLRNINGLNHYIGMKEITPDSIPELQVMPYIIAFLILFGIISVIVNKKYLIITWFLIFIVLAIIGMVDFYLWEYDYGHNLNPDAAIKIPGMSYQPPLLGTKQLLNMRTTSMPASGGWLAIISVLLAAFSLFFKLKPGVKS